ncbi:MAG TPA: argininosuccinate lyase [Thermoplasmata archaeon]|nr:argininosuccinate lyase [Thermoplasmata archaeon]
MTPPPSTSSGHATPSYVRTSQGPFLSSLAVDRALLPYDLAGSVAHAEMLGRTGMLTAEEARVLVGGLRSIGREVDAGSFPWRSELEDVHTNVEMRLTELVGTVGGKLHTARSRNDQVALDERLYLRSAVRTLGDLLVQLLEVLLARALDEAATPAPGYTHLQRAQPVTVGHTLLAHFWKFDRDLDRLLATAVRANVSPLGAGALAGSTLPIDPEYVARRLGFDRAFENSLDAVSDRDPFAELLFDLALLAVHASGMGEEIVLHATKEFGFLARTPALGSGSSQMPQKRNPDVAELIRGRTGRAVGDLVALLTALKGLPLSYDRDLQEDKAIVFDAVVTVGGSLSALTTVVREMAFDRARLRAAAADPELLATDVAEWLVARGVPFREAHEEVARQASAGSGTFDPAALRARFPSIGGDVATALDPTTAVDRRSSPGGPGAAAFGRQVALARERIRSRAESLSSLGRLVEQIEELVKEEHR